MMMNYVQWLSYDDCVVLGHRRGLLYVHSLCTCIQHTPSMMCIILFTQTSSDEVKDEAIESVIQKLCKRLFSKRSI